MIEVRLLGRFSVRRDGVEVPPTEFRGRLTGRLVRVLATRPGALVPRDVLIDALWPEHPPADPDANLNVLVARARKALGDARLIGTGPGGYFFDAVGTCTLDAEEFTVRASAGRALLAAGQAQAALRELLAALDLWSGEPLPEDLYEDWAQARRTDLTSIYLETLEAAATAALASGEPATAVSCAERAVAREPLRESAQLLLVQALTARGDRTAALAALAAYRRRLADELGLDPTDAARDLEQRILRAEPAAPAPKRRPDQLPFVGRARELTTLLAGGAPVGIFGPSGAGKSRLLTEFAARASAPVLRATAFLAERDEPWGLARGMLREALALDPDAARAVPDRSAQALIDIVPELQEIRPVPASPMSSESHRALAMEGAVRLLTTVARAGAVLCVDDLQWADATSLALLHVLVDRVPELRLVLAARSDELIPGSPPATFVDTLAGNHALVRITLGALTPAAVAELVADPDLADTISRETDGTPLAVSEVLRELAREGAVDASTGATSTGVAAPDAIALARDAARTGQKRSISARVDRQPPQAREVLALLALVCREVSAGLLGAASGTSEQQALDQLARLSVAGLVRLGDRGWLPAHDAIGETVVAGLSPVERIRLHGLLAAVLSEATERARHLEGAGDGAAAGRAYADAAEAELDRYADAEAEQLARTGLDLDGDAATRVRLLCARAEAAARRGDLPSARRDLRDALARTPAGSGRARILARSARLASGAEDMVHASDLAALALTESGDDRAARAEALAVAAIIDMNTGDAERSRSRTEEALRLFEELGDPRGVAGILDGRAMAMFLDGQVREAADAFGRVARLLHHTGDLVRSHTPRATRGHALVFLADPARGLVEIDAALDLTRQLGHPEDQAYCLWHRTEALAALGRVGEAAESADESLAIARRVGHRGWTATALRAVGIAREAAGDLPGAESAYDQSRLLSEHLDLFASWACARLALVRLALGQYESGRELAAEALRIGPPLGHYEARLAEAEVAAATGVPQAPDLARRALDLAVAGGHLASVPRLTALASVPDTA